MIVVNLSGYNVKEKLAIAENFVVPAALKEVHLSEKVQVSKEVLQYLIEKHVSDEPGVRGLKRCIEQMIQKINMLRMFNNKDLPFYIKDFQLPFVVKKEHVDLFLKEKSVDQSVAHLYT
jgi:ATP-dependent Lon protease